MIIKELLSSEIDFKKWNDIYLFDIIFPTHEEEPKQYPCVITYKIEESKYVAKDIVYYDFVYLNDFEKTEEVSKETDNTIDTQDTPQTGEEFQRLFKDGDIITCTNSACSFVSIFKRQLTPESFRRYVCLILEDNGRFSPKEDMSDFVNPRFATEDEKSKLFQAIKDNGYEWNFETKTLEKSIVPKFKVGDIIR